MGYLFNCRFKIERELFSDDTTGGAVVTGTLLISASEPSRMDSFIPTQTRISIQGLETSKSFTLLFHVGRQNPLDIREDDVVTYIFPPNDPFYNKRFRVRGVSKEAFSYNDPRQIMEVTVTRIDESRSNDSN